MQVELKRIGQFFLVAGIILLVIFFASGSGASPHYGFFFGGVAGTLLGLFFLWRGQPLPPESQRFRSLRKFRAQRRDKKKK